MIPTTLHSPFSILCGLLAILHPLSSSFYLPAFAQQPTNLPAHIVVAPVHLGRCVALHPTKPILFVGREWNTNAMNLVTFALDAQGGLVEGSRLEHADGLYTAPPIPNTSEYAVSDIAFNPNRPEMYVAATPKRLPAFRSDTNAAMVVALSLDEAGLPEQRLGAWQSLTRSLPINHIECDRTGRFLYLAEQHGFLNVWPLENEEVAGTVKFQAQKKRVPAPERAKQLRARADARRFVVKPELKLINWTYVPEWNRGYGIDSSTRRTTFVLGDDGLTVSYSQSFGSPSRVPYAPEVSVRYRKMYSPYAEGPKLGVYPLTAEGRLTSLPRFVAIDPVRFVRVDDANNRFYAVGRNSLSIYGLDAEGCPSGEPQRFTVTSGEIRDAVVSAKSGVLYVACSKPS